MTIAESASESRYTLINPEGITARVFAAGEDGSTCFSAELREISQARATLLFECQPQWHPRGRLSLSGPKLDRELVVNLEMRWVRPNSAGNWLAGYRIDPPLSKELLSDVIDRDLPTRRAWPREPARIPVEVLWESGNSRTKGLVCDISRGGLCLMTGCAPAKTAQTCIFVFTAAGEARIPLKTCWSLQAGADYFVGCQFIRHSDYGVLHKLRRNVT
jgi:hypothetical protein